MRIVKRYVETGVLIESRTEASIIGVFHMQGEAMPFYGGFGFAPNRFIVHDGKVGIIKGMDADGVATVDCVRPNGETYMTICVGHRAIREAYAQEIPACRLQTKYHSYREAPQ